jgi:hypothetical protein
VVWDRREPLPAWVLRKQQGALFSGSPAVVGPIGRPGRVAGINGSPEGTPSKYTHESTLNGEVTVLSWAKRLSYESSFDPQRINKGGLD